MLNGEQSSGQHRSTHLLATRICNEAAIQTRFVCCADLAKAAEQLAGRQEHAQGAVADQAAGACTTADGTLL